MELYDLSKSKKGNIFKKQVKQLLKTMKDKGVIRELGFDKRYSFSIDYKPQFYAPYIAYINDTLLVFFTMTSIRSDRNKIQMWDAWGIKASNKGIKVKCVEIIPSELSKYEEYSYQLELQRIRRSDLYYTIDDIIKLKDLESFLIKFKEDDG